MKRYKPYWASERLGRILAEKSKLAHPNFKLPDLSIKRHVVLKGRRSALLRQIEKEIAEKGDAFFKELKVPGAFWRAESWKGVYKFNGVPVVIKDIGGGKLHGADFKGIREVVKIHQKAVRSGEIEAHDYKIVLPRVYGVIKDRFLVMEYMQEMPKDRLVGEVGLSFINAQDRMMYNLSYMQKHPHVKGNIIHVHDRIPLGNTNPKHPEKGKWIFALPYDLMK